MNADPEVMEFFVSPMVREESDAFVDRVDADFIDRGFGLWAVDEISSGEFIGYAGLSYQTFVAAFTPTFEIGYRLSRQSWGQGYATEAAKEAVRFGFEQAGLTDVVSMTAIRNARSRAVMSKLGMTHDPDNDFNHPGVPDGHPLQRHVLYRLTAERWRNLAR
jgi:ribosomal-protein-alanine N-acetyltransferase